MQTFWAWPVVSEAQPGVQRGRTSASVRFQCFSRVPFVANDASWGSLETLVELEPCFASKLCR